MSQRLDDSLPYFSVVIPCFNSAAVLKTALDSIVAQEQACEVIVVDGLSQDDSVAIATSHPIAPIVISEPDRGIYDAINKGIALARGRLVGVLGSDDTYLEDAFSRLRTIHEEVGGDLVYGSAQLVDSTGAMSIRQDETYGPGALISGIPFSHNAMFATPETIRTVGPYRIDLKICADAQWVHRAVRLGMKASSILHPVVAFSLGGTSSVNTERIMAETYQVIAENFEGMTCAEAKLLIEAVRGWGPIEPAIEIARKHSDNPLLQLAVRDAFGDCRKNNAIPSRRILWSRQWLPRLVSLLRG